MEGLAQYVRRFLESASTAQRVAALAGLVITVGVVLYALLPFSARAGGSDTGCPPAPVAAVVGKIGATDSRANTYTPVPYMQDRACRSDGRARVGRAVLIGAVGLTVGVGGAVVLGPPIHRT